MGALREVLARFGFEIADTDKLEKAEKKADGFADKLKEIAGVLLGAVLIDKVKGFVGEIQEAADSLNDTADQLGITTDALQQWQVAAKFAGAESAELAAGFRVLTKNAVDAKDGAGAAGPVFKQLGVDVKDANGELKDVPALMRETLIGLSKIENPAERSAIAMQVLGKAGTKLAPLAKDGAEGLDQLLGKLEELGGGYSQDALEGAGAVGDALDELGLATTSLKNRLAVTLFPALSEFLRYGTKLVVGLSKAAEGTYIVQAGLIVLGAIAAKVAIATYARYLPMVAVIALLVLLVDDLITLFKGGDSLIGRALDKLFDPKTGPSVAKMIADDFDALSKRLDKAKSFGDAVEEVFGSLGSTIVKFFVDDIPEAWEFFWKDMNAKAGTGGATFTDFIKTVFSRLLDYFKDWVSDTVDEIINGIVDGLRDGSDAVKEAFVRMAKKMATGFTDIFKIKSPSKLGFEWTSEDIPDGLIGGFAARADDLDKSAKQFYSHALPPKEQASFAPVLRLPATSAAAAHAEYTVHQVNHNNFQVTGSGNTGLANAARDGVALALNDDRNAALAALETLAEEA